MPASKKSVTQAQGKTLEAQLWDAADKMRGAVPPTDYQHVCLGLVFLRYLSAAFARKHAELLETPHADPEDPEEPSGARQTAAGSPKGERGGANQYKAEFFLWVPAEARWSHLQASAKQPTIGKTVDDAMVAIERDNPRLKGVLPKDYARPVLDTALRDSAISTREATPQSLSAAKDNHRLGELIDIIATISLTAASEGEKNHRSVDLLGRVYDWSGATKTAAGSPNGERGGAHQYFLTRFACAEGKNGGQPSGARQTAKGSPKGERGGAHQFYNPSCVVRCLVEILAPYTALRCSAFLQSEAKQQVVSEAKDNFRKDDDVRWQWSGATWTTRKGCPEGERGGVHQFGVPPKGNANFAWVQHFIHHLAPQTAQRDSAFLQSKASPQVVSEAKDNMAGFVLANGSMSSNQSGDCPARSAIKTPKAKPQSLPRQRDIRRALIEADLVDCMVALPKRDKFTKITQHQCLAA
jgi:type I restriction enzyme M protein